MTELILKDLFGRGVRIDPDAPMRPKPKRKPTQPRGYADRPGTGPKGETCKTCRHYTRTATRSGKEFRKCLLMRAAWTHGPGTDIKAGAPACQKWERVDG